MKKIISLNTFYDNKFFNNFIDERPIRYAYIFLYLNNNDINSNKFTI